MEEIKYKIIAVSNFDDAYVSDYLIADNLNEYYGEMIVKFLQDKMNENDDYYPKLVKQDYKLYEFKP